MINSLLFLSHNVVKEEFIPGRRKGESSAAFFLLICAFIIVLVILRFLRGNLVKLSVYHTLKLGFFGSPYGKESACRRPGFNPWVGKIPWRRDWQPTPVFLPGEFHGQRSLVGYSLGGCKESDTTE